jgi:hypothetical protein
MTSEDDRQAAVLRGAVVRPARRATKASIYEEEARRLAAQAPELFHGTPGGPAA